MESNAKNTEETIGRIKIAKEKIIGKGSDGGVVYEGLYANVPVAIKRICLPYLNESDPLNPSVQHNNLMRCFAKEEDSDF